MKLRNFHLDATLGEGTAEDKHHRMDFLRVWDFLDFSFKEYPESGFTWIVDPKVHHDDDFF